MSLEFRVLDAFELISQAMVSKGKPQQRRLEEQGGHHPSWSQLEHVGSKLGFMKSDHKSNGCNRGWKFWLGIKDISDTVVPGKLRPSMMIDDANTTTSMKDKDSNQHYWAFYHGPATALCPMHQCFSNCGQGPSLLLFSSNFFVKYNEKKFLKIDWNKRRAFKMHVHLKNDLIQQT